LVDRLLHCMGLDLADPRKTNADTTVPNVSEGWFIHGRDTRRTTLASEQ